MSCASTSSVSVFFLSILFGAFLSIVFDIFKLFNIVISDKPICEFINDALYFSFSGFLTYLFLLITINGEIRFFVFIGEVIGWTLHHVTIGRYFVKFTFPIIFSCKKFLKNVCSKAVTPLLKTSKFKSFKISLIIDKIKFFQKSVWVKNVSVVVLIKEKIKTFKLLLKPVWKILLYKK